MAANESLPLPDDPVLAHYAEAFNRAGHWAEISDASGRLVYVTDDLRRTYSGSSDLAPVPVGLFYWGPEALLMRLSWSGLGTSTIEM